MHRGLIGSLLALAGLLLTGSAPSATVRIVATDFALQAPDSVTAGTTEFVLENHGVLVHELVIGLLRPGAGVPEMVEGAKHNLRLRDLTDHYLEGPPFGALLAWPGATSSAHLVIDLQPGRDYAPLCQLRESPETPQHAALGMVRVLHVH